MRKYIKEKCDIIVIKFMFDTKLIFHPPKKRFQIGFMSEENWSFFLLLRQKF